MRNIFVVAITCIVAFNFFCCVNPVFSQTTASPSAATMEDGAVIRLERLSGGFCADCPPCYTLAIYEDGTVVYEGIKFVKTNGKVTTNIGKEKVKEIMAKIEKSGFFSINRNYIAIDRPVSALSVNFQGKTKRVENSYGFYSEVKEAQNLMALENEIDEIVQSAQWIK